MPIVSATSGDWEEMVERIRRGDARGAEDLYRTMVGGTRNRLARTVDPQMVDDKFHDVVVTVLSAIQGGALREPERLMGFVQTITQRQVALHIRHQVSRRRMVPLDATGVPASTWASPEAAMATHQQSLAIRRVLQKLKPRDREILVRFYLHEQDYPKICHEMALTATQFRLYKSRAIARCLALAQRGSARPGFKPPNRNATRIA